MRKGTDHDALHHALEILGHVIDRLALAQVDFRGREVQGEPSKLVDTDIETDPGAQRRLLEDQGQGFAFELLGVIIGARLNVAGEVEETGDGEFFGEGALAGQALRMGSATAMTDCAALRIDKKAMMQALHREHTFSDMFVAHLLARNIRYEEDLVDQLFNSSEKRLARILLLLAHFGKEGKPETVVPKISQEMLAEMVGTTRSRVSFFMNRFRKLGFVDYSGSGLQVHSSLLNIVLHD